MKKLLVAVALAVALVAIPVWAEEDTVCMEDASKSMKVENPELALSQITRITSEGAYMKIYSGISVADTLRMWNDVVWLKDNTDIRDIYLFINSPGGSAFDGLAMANWIEKFQKEWGFTFHATANGIIASAAVPVFAVCKSRNALVSTIFMVHEAALFKWPGRETASDIRSQNNLMIMLSDSYLQILADNSKLTIEQWKEKEGRTTWFSRKDAKEWGLINE